MKGKIGEAAASEPQRVRKYEVIVRFTSREATGYEVFAESEEAAKNIAKYRLSQDRRDYDSLADIAAEIRTPR